MNVLEKIIATKRQELVTLKAKLPLESFIDQLVPSEKDMYAALDRNQGSNNAGFIFECKKASPSKGLIRADFDIKQIAQAYDKYAAAISVLTDETYFQGHYDYLKVVTETVACPVLNKDFFIDTYQVYLARFYGADAILLMLSVLTDEQYNCLSEVAKRYNLAVLTEVSNASERDRAIALNAKLIGINNRNLRDLSTDITRTLQLAPTIPDDRIVIAESGIYDNHQVRELAPAVDGFLVGSSIMAQKDIDLACRQLIFGHNKVCGLTRPEDAKMVCQVGAEFGGLIFAQSSPRCVSEEQAKLICQAEPGLNYVGVFVNRDLDDVVKLAEQLSLYAVQLHGKEDQLYVATLTERLANSSANECLVWQAVAVESSIPALPELVNNIVLDGKNAGSGKPFSWQSINESSQDLSTCYLAGGLSSENIDQAVAFLLSQDLVGLDVNSGVESSPGIKNHQKLQQIFAQIRNY